MPLKQISVDAWTCGLPDRMSICELDWIGNSQEWKHSVPDHVQTRNAITCNVLSDERKIFFSHVRYFIPFGLPTLALVCVLSGVLVYFDFIRQCATIPCLLDREHEKEEWDGKPEGAVEMRTTSWKCFFGDGPVFTVM